MNTQRRDWIILRCSGASTLKLAASLKTAGFEVWTPMVQNSARRPRTRKPKELVPAMPTYLFAAARHLHTLLAERGHPASDHPDFSVFQHYGRIPLIADAELAPLRTAERKSTPLENVRKFTQGERVKLTEGGFAGMSGVVEGIRGKGKFTLVSFPGYAIPIDIDTMLLLADEQQSPAKAA